MRLCVVECLHLRKAFGPGLEKHQSGNSACTKILAMEVGWEVNVKVQESRMSLNSSKTVGRGKPLFSSSVQCTALCLCPPYDEGAKFRSRKNAMLLFCTGILFQSWGSEEGVFLGTQS